MGLVLAVCGALRGTTFAAGRYREFNAWHGQPALELGYGDDGPLYVLTAEGVEVVGVVAVEECDRVFRGHAAGGFTRCAAEAGLSPQARETRERESAQARETRERESEAYSAALAEHLDTSLV